LVTLWSFGAWGAAKLLIVSTKPSPADAIVVLSGSSTINERAQYAAKLYCEGRSSKIVLTNDNVQGGWSKAEQRNAYSYERAQKELQRLGVPQESIEIVGPPVTSTHDEAISLRRFSENNGLSSILVVTSAYHSRRALWTFRHVFQGCRTQVSLDPVDTGIQTPPPATWWLHLRGWLIVPTEYIKIVYYWLRFR
jgi:uncharacterized SAM-binding protein YcdF (DUF218 family)